jgi:hypothetical protein
MLLVYIVNFDYYLQETFETHEEAAAAGRATGFEFTIIEAK